MDHVLVYVAVGVLAVAVVGLVAVIRAVVSDGRAAVAARGKREHEDRERVTSARAAALAALMVSDPTLRTDENVALLNSLLGRDVFAAS